VTLSIAGYATNYQSFSRAVTLVRYDAQKLADDAFAALLRFNSSPPNQPSWYGGARSLILNNYLMRFKQVSVEYYLNRVLLEIQKE